MQVSLARTKSSFAGLTMFARDGLRDVLAAGPVAPLAADVPLGDGLRLDVVVDRVAAVAERAGRPLHVVGRIVRHPPVGVRLHEVRPPDAVASRPTAPAAGSSRRRPS